MPRLVWDKVGTRQYESGLDRGVLYLPDGKVVPWNGLTSVVEKFDKESTSTYYDGVKINELITLGSFAASLKAVTYPDEFAKVEGNYEIRPGMTAPDQPPLPFILVYRTKVGNDLDGDEVYYKIHIIFNVLAVPSDKTYASIGDDPSLVEFEWDLVAVPEEFPGFKPTAQIILQSNMVDPWLLEELENYMYGTDVSFPQLIHIPDFFAFVNSWYRVDVVDNGDGTWTATEHLSHPDFIFMMDIGLTEFELRKIKASYLDESTFVLSTTKDIRDSPYIGVTDNGDGTWSATSDEGGLVELVGDGMFEINDIEIEYETANVYRLSDKFY